MHLQEIMIIHVELNRFMPESYHLIFLCKRYESLGFTTYYSHCLKGISFTICEPFVFFYLHMELQKKYVHFSFAVFRGETNSNRAKKR